ncbi:glycogen/starch/alpha-glucan phosphorylase [Pseudoalteromonas sp. Scap03]|uniref:glycogen/starch/alpha-glucan phosphorylase n=1 Tax=unclassified Pseudoalteromonas TaxID=194690 RepID=UPI0015B7A0DB|nr:MULTISPECIES: glycogen/starch/alpha-glucan phosphorylase [unclassified Pseudoalteromonas]NWL17361.1 glycogen/starch/alpha-glucan phosphorylase [Pseudoalteromonas sp. Scap03]QLE83401.1 glycogen/starch/alpha-glucan phosphorylase [Pseudoalteromonas sp. Scap25]QLE91343.1 glycogen/starch/alpha-glucan phosphorylase [Pseudoalteromonas sp. Scap06]
MTKQDKQVCVVKSWQEGPLIDESTLSDDLTRHFYYTLGRDVVGESQLYLYHALALTIRDRLVARCRDTNKQIKQHKRRKTAYLSLEFLMGRALGNAVLNLDLEAQVSTALQAYCTELENVEQAEHDAGLGNGGLGRLAACFLDSCASLALPVVGYGIRYEYGMFNQSIKEGNQVEQPDNWLREGHPWELSAPEQAKRVKFSGYVQSYTDKFGREHRQWVSSQDVLAVPYDVPIPGYKNNIVNTLRLWKSEATDEFNLAEFNAGSYSEAVAQKNLAEQITMVLYPNDSSENGKELRLRQQYFLSSASIQDVLSQWIEQYGDDFTDFAQHHVFQLNDTHPSIAVAELMRILVDDHELDWDQAWNITTKTMAYTNHTLLPEALEKWSVALFAKLLPRILEIIFEINARFLAEVARHWPGDVQKQRDLSLIEEGEEPQIRMAFLAIVGSYSVNGVAALHTQLLTAGLFKDFYSLWPEKFNNKTNGVTPRRWLAYCNPGLSHIISEKIGKDWVGDFAKISQLRRFYDDPQLHVTWQQAKRQNKQRLVDLVKQKCGVEFDVNMLFDVQVKRIHEYKRQLLNVLHVIHLYDRIRRGDTQGMVPRCVLLGGKAAPGYMMAKKIIKLINNVAEVINKDPEVSMFLRVAFLPNYNVTAMETICPATDLSEQVSTAGKEASGTGNMKFMMNGALTIGTLDGANIEIRDAVGAENFFLFGAQAEHIDEIKAHYNPSEIIANNPDLNNVMHLLESGHFNLFEPGLFDDVINCIKSKDDAWLTAHDFASYISAQREVDKAYADQTYWTQMSILNTAASGLFSSDRTIGQYCDDIWHLTPLDTTHQIVKTNTDS